MVLVFSGCSVKDYGNLCFEDVPSDEPVGRVKRPGAVGSANQRLAHAVYTAKKEGHTTLMLGGDHRCVCKCVYVCAH